MPMDPLKKLKIAVGVVSAFLVVGIVTTGVLVWEFGRESTNIVDTTTMTANPPAPLPHVLGSRVYVFSVQDDPAAIEYVLDQYYSVLGGAFPGEFNGQFDDTRVCFCFMPGNYPVSIPVGYYTQVLGLGATPEETIIQGRLFSANGATDSAGALDNFWRCVENITFQTDSTWSVSQGCSMRRVVIEGDLNLVETPLTGAAGDSSGGFIADSRISGTIKSESQQQFCTRNTDFESWPDAVWNMVFIGCRNPPSGICPPNQDAKNANTSVAQTPLIREKPFLVVNTEGQYEIRVPALRTDAVGPDDSNDTTLIPFEDIYVAKTTDSAADINAQLTTGKHILLTPGQYRLSDPLRITMANTVVMGLGYATLIATSGNAVLEIGDVEGTKICSVLMQAGNTNSPYLMRIGDTAGASGSTTNPTVLSDVYARIGGPDTSPTSITDCTIVNSNHVLVDNMWLWRADHGGTNGIGWTINTAQNGLVVNGASVFAYGLAVEHFQNLQVEWKNNDGRVYFYQSEAPYDSPTPGDYTQPNFKVSSGVTGMIMQGCGAYCFFRDSPVVQPQGFDVAGASVTGTFLFTRWLNGQPTSQITNVINAQGAAVTTTSRLSYVCSFP